MKKNTGLITVLTVALAFFGISQLPRSAPTGGATPETKTSRGTTPAKTSATPQLYAACTEIKKRLLPFFKLSPFTESKRSVNEQSKLPESCYLGTWVGVPTPTPPSGLQFAIALVPNPVTTHLPLWFDRAIEAIQQAAQDNNYSYDSSWFPWNDAPKDYTHLTDQLAAAEVQAIQQQQPGLITFRRALLQPTDEAYAGGLLVFVVGEQPTGGIDREQFDNALRWLDQFSALRQLKILGPSFSGSVPSLVRALEDFNQTKPFSANSINVYSGTVTSELAYDMFNKFLDRTKLGSFRTTMERDSLSVDRFCSYIRSQDYHLSRVAILSEDETAFGTLDGKRSPLCYDDQNGGAIYLYYPRDIATLRSAYEQQSVFDAGKRGSSGGTSSTTLRGDLSEPSNSDHDTVRSYGGQLTPLAQESVLTGIVNIINQKKIQFVVLRSTSSLDQIFLTRFLRRTYPSARIVIDNADLLFRRGSEGASLRGVMMLSTYPLLTWQQDWTSFLLYEQTGSYRIFGEDNAEGIYVAGRVLLSDPDRPSTVPIANYAPPAWALSGHDNDDHHPATWLSTIGRHQFWPLAVLNSHTLAENPSPFTPITSQLDNVRASGNPYPLRIEPEFALLMVLYTLWSLLHLGWCWQGSIAPSTSFLRTAYFAPLHHRQHSILIALGSLLPALGAVVVEITAGVFTRSMDSQRSTALASWGLLIVLLSILACWSNYNLPIASAVQPTRIGSPRWQATIGILALVIFISFLIYRLHFVYRYTHISNRIPLFWRSIHILSGVSPLLPQLLIIFGLYLWFWFNLRGLSLFGNDRPLLPKLNSLPTAQEIENFLLFDSRSTLAPVALTSLMPMFSREEGAKPIEKVAIPLGLEHLKTLILALALAVLILLLALQTGGLQTLGEKAFGSLILKWLGLCIGLILSDTMQLWRIWKKLRSLLIHLDRLPLRRTLAALKGLSWESVWAMSGHALEERYRVISRQLESLRHLKNRLEEWHPNDVSTAKPKSDLLEKINHCLDTTGPKFVEWFVKLKDEAVGDIKPLYEFQDELATVAGAVLTNLLIPAWRKEKQSLILESKPPIEQLTNRDKDKDKDEDASGVSIPTTGVPDYVLAGEEFFVLPYLGFIQNILGRIRTIVLGMLFLFVAMTFAVSSYPFDPLPMLGAAFLVVFSITALTVILVYAAMHRDATLSHITNTRPGELGGHFYLQLITFGIGPLLGLLTTLFPSITDFVTSWLEPSVQAIK